jgi:AraC-like DNA-binding protein
LYIPAMNRPAPLDPVPHDPAAEEVSLARSGAVGVHAWAPGIAGIREVLHASFGEHVYPPHVHDVWTLFIVDVGALRYDLDRRPGGAVPSMVSVLPPHVVHDGRPTSPTGYRKRVIYIEAGVIGEELVGAAVDRPVLQVHGLRSRVAALHDALACIDERFEAEARLAFVVERIRATLGAVALETSPAPADLGEAFRAWLDERVFEPVTLADAARELSAGETRLARAFTDAFGITPHTYVTGRRLEAARRRILDGQRLADVAAEVGFVDQPHLTRRFRQFLGTTPGRFAGRRYPGRERSAGH